MQRPAFLAFIVVFNISLAWSSSAHAFDFRKNLANLVEKAKESNTSIPASKASNVPKVSDSKFYFSKDTSLQTKWMMINIVKDGKKEHIIIAVKDARVSKTLYLRNGAGIYDIQIAESASTEKYGPGYFVSESLKIENSDQRDLSFLMPSDLVQSNNEEIISLAKKLTENARDQLDAVRKIHHFVATNIKYDYESYKDKSFETKPYDALLTLKNRTAVCSGYANLYAALTRAIGIRTKVIHGIGYTSSDESGPHAWNEVFVNNEWKSVDATWDSTTGNIFKYFDIADEVFIQNHQKEKEQDI